MTIKTWLRRTSFILLSCAAMALPVQAEEDKSQSYDLEIDALPLMAAVKTLSDETGIEVLFFSEIAEGVTSAPVQGEYTPNEALETMLASTDLEVVDLDKDGAVAIRPIGEAQGPGKSQPASSQMLMAQNQTSAQQNQTRNSSETTSNEDEGATSFEEIIVVGSHIRGVAADSSPIFAFDREDIAASGATSTQQFIQTLPQNFGGGSSENIAAAPNNSTSLQNTGSGSSVNLRGLGSGATLVLLNGRRLAPASGIGNFVDISLIPLNAIERVEVLADGASSLYGGDAVAGVVNFVLRDDFDGGEAYVRYGTVTEGDMNEYQAGLTFGNNWDSGNVLISYDYSNRDNLGVQDREFSKEEFMPTDLLPEQERHSVLLTGSQKILDNSRIFGDVLFSRREANKTTSVNADPDDTFFDASKTEQIALAVGTEIGLGRDWVLEASGGYSRVTTFRDRSNRVDGSTNIRDLDSDQWTLDAIATGNLLHLSGGAVGLAAGVHYREEDFSNFDVDAGMMDRSAKRDVAAAFAELNIPLVGERNAKRGIARLELNISGRYEDYSDFGTSWTPKVGVLWAPTEQLRFRSSFGESFNPPNLGQVGASNTAVTALSNDFLNAVFAFPTEVSNGEVALFRFGTDSQLDAEESETWTVGLDYDRNFGSNSLSFGATYFSVEFIGRINQPTLPGNVFNAVNLFLSDDPALPQGMVVRNPTAAEVDILTALATQQSGFNNPLGFFTTSDNVGFIVNFIDDNRSFTDVDGLDLDLSYTRDTNNGNVLAAIHASLLFSFDEQTDATTPVIDVADTIFNPADVKLRGQFGWNHERWSTSLFLNYIGDYLDNRNSPETRIDSWFTADLNVAFGLHGGSDSRDRSKLRLALSVINIFDEEPPSILSIPTLVILGYDPTNASPLGRFVNLQITKEW